MVMEIPQAAPESLETVDAMTKTVEEAQREREAEKPWYSRRSRTRYA